MKWFGFILLLSTIQALSQDSCFVGTINTNKVGNGKQYIFFETDFIIKDDTIIMTNGVDSTALYFKILGKDCLWQKPTQNGKSSYEVVVLKNGRKAIIHLKMDAGNKIIELNYEDSKELRVFSVSGFSISIE